MNGLLSLLLAGATISGAVEEQAPKPKIDVSAQIYMPDGKASGASRRVELGTEPVVLYLYTGKTLCEARTVSTEKPMVAGNGWKLELTAAPGAPAAKGAAVVKATWQRLWEGGKELPSSGAKASTVTLTPGNTVALDTIDGSGRRLAREVAVRVQRWKPGDPIPVEVQRDKVVENLSGRIETSKGEIEKMQQSLGDHHPNLVEARSALEWLQKRRDEQVRLLIDEAIGVTGGTSSVDGCAALSMNLQVGIEKPGSFSPVTETELWLIHRDPSGKETEQRQVVRSRESSGEYFFDDVKIQTEKGPVTIEIYGSVHESMTGEGGEPWLLLDVRRRYIATGPRTPQQLVFPAYTWKTKEGNTSYRQTIHQNEVVSFQLLPLPDDEGALSGHRFSVRVRMRVLQ